MVKGESNPRKRWREVYRTDPSPEPPKNIWGQSINQQFCGENCMVYSIDKTIFQLWFHCSTVGNKKFILYHKRIDWIINVKKFHFSASQQPCTLGGKISSLDQNCGSFRVCTSVQSFYICCKYICNFLLAAFLNKPLIEGTVRQFIWWR